MKLTTKGMYGLRAMIELAMNLDQGPISIKSIGEKHNISDNYLEQIIAVLRKAGFVKSIRGAKGGYCLNQKPTSISVGDILRILEGDLNPVDCTILNEEKQCEGADLCVSKFVWKKISDSINEVVDNITLEDLVKEQERLIENKELDVRS